MDRERGKRTEGGMDWSRSAGHGRKLRKTWNTTPEGREKKGDTGTPRNRTRGTLKKKIREPVTEL